MDYGEWDTNPDGTIKVFPVVAYECFAPLPNRCGLRLHFAQSESELASGRSTSVPFIMAAAEARELASALLAVAEQSERLQAGENPR